MTHWILAINPGSTSTKLTVYEDDSLYASETLRHDPSELAPVITEQLGYRRSLFIKWLDSVYARDKLNAVVGRGGM